jgi:flavin reductase (DIM6/NTAB) family NADH-FMN oxidoreductase RutF
MDAFTGRVDYPLSVVTVSGGDDEVSGCLAGFTTQCSIVPPRLLVCISKVNHTYFVAERARVMALHLLGEDQHSLASLFGELTGDSVDKFSRCEWRRGDTGAPVLSHCAAWLEGTVLDHFGVGDHEAFVMSPVGGGRGDRPGLLTLKDATDLDAGHPAHP